MEEIELINNDSLEKVRFSKDDLYSPNQSLNFLLKSYYSSDNQEYRLEILGEIKRSHEVTHEQFHEMRRAFRRKNKYWVMPLNIDKLREKIKEGERNYPNNKERYLQFTFNGWNNAKFRYRMVNGFDFNDKLSCYAEVLVKRIIDEYDNIYVVKGRNDLSDDPVVINGKIYDGQYRIAMLKCKLKQPISSSEKDSFHYYDVVHDPGCCE